MPLENRVGLIPFAQNGCYDRAGTGDKTIPLACHWATSIWTFWEAFERMPTTTEMIKLGSPTLFLRKLLKHGNRVQQKGGKQVVLTSGSVIVFASEDDPKHSCVATSEYTVGGYNQTNWFTGPGKENDFTVHNTTEMRWLPEGDEVMKCSVLRTKQEGQPDKVEQTWNANYEIYSIPEKVAVKGMKAEFGS